MRRYECIRYVFFMITFLLIVSCQRAYFETMETLGHQRKDILADRVRETRDEQSKTMEQFSFSFAQFKIAIESDSGDLQSRYALMEKEYETCLKKYNLIEDSIRSVENTAAEFFTEWEKDLSDNMKDARKEEERARYTATEKQYNELISGMKNASSKMSPVIYAYKDIVLYLKHNLNAYAISSLKSELIRLEFDLESLTLNTKLAIQNADSFILAMEMEE